MPKDARLSPPLDLFWRARSYFCPAKLPEVSEKFFNVIGSHRKYLNVQSRNGII